MNIVKTSGYGKSRISIYNKIIDNYNHTEDKGRFLGPTSLKYNTEKIGGKMELKIGTKVFLEPMGNLARRNTNLKEGEITKIGRKYFYIDKEKFDIETLKNINEDNNSSWILYFVKQDYLDKIETGKLMHKIREFFSWHGEGKKLSLEQLREIAKIARI